MKYTVLKNLISKSRFLVCLQGLHISEDCGCMNYRGDRDSYEIEKKYARSPEEMFNTGFFNTRPQQFYDFYRNEMLASLGTPNRCLAALQKLEADGRLKYIITRELYSLAKRAGCKNVIELHGTVYDYHCPHCGKLYTIKDILSSREVPLCKDCGAVIRPDVALMGTALSNQKLSRAADLIGRADTLLIIGCNMKSVLPEMSLQFFHGDHIVLINEAPHYADYKANHVYYGSPSEILSQVC